MNTETFCLAIVLIPSAVVGWMLLCNSIANRWAP